MKKEFEKIATDLSFQTKVHHSKKEMLKITTKQSFSRLSKITMVLHTDTARSFFRGGWAYREMGLRQFATTMQTLWLAAKAHDPYAEWHLMQIYDQLCILAESYGYLEMAFQNKIMDSRLEIEIFTNPTPFRFSLNFGTPFSYMAADLLVDLDGLLRYAYTLKQIGILLKEEMLPTNMIQKLQHLFTQGRQWKQTGITRKDIAQSNEKSKMATASMGELPQAIFDKSVQFEFLPKNRSKLVRH